MEGFRIWGGGRKDGSRRIRQAGHGARARGARRDVEREELGLGATNQLVAHALELRAQRGIGVALVLLLCTSASARRSFSATASATRLCTHIMHHAPC